MAQGELRAGDVGSISIEDLAALNEEISALVRAGMPLERGLLGAGQDLPGGLGRITRMLGERMKRGETLAQALEAEKAAIPPLYRSVVEAGARSGRLPIALEGLARYVRGYSEARAAVGVALWYPIVVLTLAYGLFLGLVVLVVPRFVLAFDSLRIAVPWPLVVLQRLGELAPYWWPVWPILLVLLVVAWWRSGRTSTFQSTSWSVLRMIPWMRSLLSDYEAAGFAELLALLLENGVPLPRAVQLAAASTGNAAAIAGAKKMAEGVERGESPAEAARGLTDRAIRPLIRWSLSAGESQGSTVKSLHALAPMYRLRGLHQAEKLQLFLPTILMLLIGGTATLLYGLTLFLPLVGLLRGLSSP
jgi:general secretion pathway protein F